ncbi:MAG: winged helix-turn-helix transcriptional regulator [Methanobacteriota archaeon]
MRTIPLLGLTLLFAVPSALAAGGSVGGGEHKFQLDGQEFGVGTDDVPAPQTGRCYDLPASDRCLTPGSAEGDASAATGDAEIGVTEPGCRVDRLNRLEREQEAGCEEADVQADLGEVRLTYSVGVSAPTVATPGSIQGSSATPARIDSRFLFVSWAGGASPLELAFAAGVVLASVLAVLWKLGMLVPLYSKLAPEELLTDETRRGLYEAIKTNPGLSVKDLSERLGLGWGTALHHLNKLERRHLVVSKRFGKYKRYFMNGGAFDEHEKLAVAALKTPGTADVARVVLAVPGLSQKEVAAELGVAPSTVLWHMKRLSTAGVVDAVRDGKTVRYYPHTAPQGAVPESSPLRA